VNLYMEIDKNKELLKFNFPVFRKRAIIELMKANADLSISEGSIEALIYYLHILTKEVISKAQLLVRHAGRKKITPKFMNLAIKLVRLDKDQFNIIKEIKHEYLNLN